MPEGVKYIFVRNAPWIVQKGYQWLKGFIPLRTQKKIFLFSKDEEDKYLARLFEEIDRDQIPVCFGGSCKVPWPFGEGGEITEEGEYKTINVSKLEIVKTTVAPNTTCLVEVKVVSKDINVRIEVNGEGSEEAVATVVYDNVKVRSMEGWRSFQYTAPENIKNPITLSVTFDNSFSWLLGKTVNYRIISLDDK